ncbi:unnamed protein product [Chrysoparadoxa australica]
MLSSVINSTIMVCRGDNWWLRNPSQLLDQMIMSWPEDLLMTYTSQNKYMRILGGAGRKGPRSLHPIPVERLPLHEDEIATLKGLLRVVVASSDAEAIAELKASPIPPFLALGDQHYFTWSLTGMLQLNMDGSDWKHYEQHPYDDFKSKITMGSICQRALNGQGYTCSRASFKARMQTLRQGSFIRMSQYLLHIPLVVSVLSSAHMSIYLLFGLPYLVFFFIALFAMSLTLPQRPDGGALLTYKASVYGMTPAVILNLATSNTWQLFLTHGCWALAIMMTATREQPPLQPQQQQRQRHVATPAAAAATVPQAVVHAPPQEALGALPLGPLGGVRAALVPETAELSIVAASQGEALLVWRPQQLSKCIGYGLEVLLSPGWLELEYLKSDQLSPPPPTPAPRSYLVQVGGLSQRPYEFRVRSYRRDEGEQTRCGAPTTALLTG